MRGDSRDARPGALAPQTSSAALPPPRCSDAHAQVLDLEVVLDAVLRALAAQARLLDPAERRDLVRDQPGIDADHAVFEPFGHAPDARDVAGVEVRRETEFGVVGPASRGAHIWIIGNHTNLRDERPG